MTKEEFNKLPKQERIELAWDKVKLVFDTADDNPTRYKRQLYARLSEEDEWRLVCTQSSSNNWFSEISGKFFPNARVISIGYEGERKCFFKSDSFYGGMELIDNNDIPDKFLETAMFEEIPQGDKTDVFLDKFNSAAYLAPYMVYNMSKQIPMEMGDYIELSKKLGYWATKQDATNLKLQDVAVGLGDDIDKLVEAFGIAKHNRILKIFWGSVAIIVGIILILFMC